MGSGKDAYLKSMESMDDAIDRAYGLIRASNRAGTVLDLTDADRYWLHAYCTISPE